MKKSISAIVFVWVMYFLVSPAKAQPATPYKTLTPSRIEVTVNKTTNIVFPFAIRSVDRGSSDILVQKAKEVDNVLQVKAAKPAFDFTNLTVITSDGQLYPFLVYYSAQPAALNIQYVKDDRQNVPLTLFTQEGENEALKNELLSQVASKLPVLTSPKDRREAIAISLSGVYVHENVMYYQLQMQNNSALNYTVGQLRFFIKDQTQSKRTASAGTGPAADQHQRQLQRIAGRFPRNRCGRTP